MVNCRHENDRDFEIRRPTLGHLHTARERAGELADSLRTVVEAPSKLAEETASQLGFGDTWAHPVSSEEMRRAQWLHKRRPGHQQKLPHKPSRRINI
jgi:hypothetical protein